MPPRGETAPGTLRSASPRHRRGGHCAGRAPAPEAHPAAPDACASLRGRARPGLGGRRRSAARPERATAGSGPKRERGPPSVRRAGGRKDSETECQGELSRLRAASHIAREGKHLAGLLSRPRSPRVTMAALRRSALLQAGRAGQRVCLSLGSRGHGEKPEARRLGPDHTVKPASPAGPFKWGSPRGTGRSWRVCEYLPSCSKAGPRPASRKWPVCAPQPQHSVPAAPKGLNILEWSVNQKILIMLGYV